MRRVVMGEADFVTFAGVSTRRLRSTAFGMCRDWHLAQDLTQVTLVKLYAGWARASKADSLEAYAHTTLLRTYLDHRRRRSSTEHTVAMPVEALATVPEHHDTADLRLTMLDALAQLPPRDRAILVLRFWEDRSVERVAEVLGVPVAVVKTQTRRSLAKLRELLGAQQYELYG
jgi:RNA polymerase sigma-70 factor (sigma-E family)